MTAGRSLFVLRGDIPSDKSASRIGDFSYANELVAFVKDFGGFKSPDCLAILRQV